LVESLWQAEASAPNGLKFEPSSTRSIWTQLSEEGIGSGYYRDRFLYLFGEGLENFSECLEAKDAARKAKNGKGKGKDSKVGRAVEAGNPAEGAAKIQIAILRSTSP
jgi:hypothetical protein